METSKAVILKTGSGHLRKVPAAVISRVKVSMFWIGAVPDPDLEIREGGGGAVIQTLR